jgi:hypothetical protein
VRTSRPAQADVARRAEERIKTREVLTVIENGRGLIEVKEALGHGHFATWVKQAFRGAITIRAAQLWMNAAERYGDKSDIMSLLSDTVMMVLSAPSMPDGCQAVRRQTGSYFRFGPRSSVANIGLLDAK